MFNFKDSLARLNFLKERLKNYGRLALGVIAGFAAASTDVLVLKLTLFTLAAGLLIYGGVKSFELVHRRLISVAPGRDVACLWGVYVIAAILTSGLSSLLLFFVPAGALAKKENK